MEKLGITIVGGGIVGCAIAYALSKQYDKVLLIEKNPPRKIDIPEFIGDNQTSRNAGVIHAGIYYPYLTMPLRAKLCVKGNQMMYDFCEEFSLPHKKVGKLLVATDEYSEMMLQEQYEIASYNGVPGIRFLTPEEVRNFEPNVYCTKALYSPSTGIVDPVRVTHKLSILANREYGTITIGGNEVVAIKPISNRFEVTAKNVKTKESFTFETKYMVNSAGLFSDEVARMANPDSPYKIKPLKLECATFNRTRRPGLEIKMNIYPAPYYIRKADGKIIKPIDKEINRELGKTILKTVGAHLTPEIMSDGTFSPEATISPVSAGSCLPEDYKNSLNLEVFLNRVKTFFPNLTLEDLAKTDDPTLEVGHRVGIAADLENHTDFVIAPDQKYPQLINLLGIGSPGMTSSLAIAEYVEELLRQI